MHSCIIGRFEPDAKWKCFWGCVFMCVFIMYIRSRLCGRSVHSSFRVRYGIVPVEVGVGFYLPYLQPGSLIYKRK